MDRYCDSVLSLSLFLFLCLSVSFLLSPGISGSIISLFLWISMPFFMIFLAKSNRKSNYKEIVQQGIYYLIWQKVWRYNRSRVSDLTAQLWHHGTKFFLFYASLLQPPSLASLASHFQVPRQIPQSQLSAVLKKKKVIFFLHNYF